MKKLQVLVQNKNTLVLLEDGRKDDLIDLSELANVDLTALEEVIESGKDQVYQKKLNELKESFEKEKLNELEILKLSLSKKHVAEINELSKTIDNYDANKNLEIEKLKSSYDSEIERLNAYIQQIIEAKDDVVNGLKLELENKYMKEINNLKQELNSLKPQHELEVEKIKSDYELQLSELKISHSLEINKKNEIINQKEMLYQELQNRKASLNVKMIGEGLETWCNNEMLSYMQNGFTNCKWIKDNKVVKNEDDESGSKADYIFNIYASDECKTEELLANVCLEMKDENPYSTNKKKNSEYFSALHKNRVKKACKYAVLVSNLELNNPNDLPILKVKEYEDMYVVRPAYMLVLLNMITSLTTNFKDLLLEAHKQELEIKAKTILLEQFEALKKSYLETGLIKLENHIKDIRTKSTNIIKAADDIDNICSSMINGYIREIQKKLDTFEIKITREYKKYEKNSLGQ